MVDGKWFSSNQQYYAYNKAKTFCDTTTASKIMLESNPVEMKNLGKHVLGFDHKVWSNTKVEVMKRGLQAKFKNERLREILLDTKDATLMEASPYDKFWGVGLSKNNRRIWQKNNWHGHAKNMMGQLLYEIRLDLKREEHEKTEEY